MSEQVTFKIKECFDCDLLEKCARIYGICEDSPRTEVIDNIPEVWNGLNVRRIDGYSPLGAPPVARRNSFRDKRTDIPAHVLAVEKIADTFKTVKGKSISKNTVARYIAALENAFLIQKARRYNVKGRKYIGALVKYYFTDVGIRNCILGFRQQEESHIMENVIYNELRRRGWEVDVGVVETWDKSSTGSRFRNSLEIDFVCNKGSARYYIQSAFMVPDREKMAQEQRPFSHVPDSFCRVMIVKEAATPWYNEQGTLIVGLNDFLSDASILERTPADSHSASPLHPAVARPLKVK